MVRCAPAASGGEVGREAPSGLASPGATDATTPDAARRRARGHLWADLMRRAFGFDVLACPRCGGRLRLIALIDQASVIQQILGHLGLPTEIPALTPARAPPQLLKPEIRNRQVIVKMTYLLSR